MTPDRWGQIRKLPPLERIRAAGKEIEQTRADASELSRIRADAIAELRRERWTFAEIARELGVSRQTIHRLMRED